MWAKHKQDGFTIVELLIVIVVIGVLASISIVAYSGINQRAVAASLSSDLASATKQLKLFQVDYSAYPTTINCAIADSATNKCLKSSNGTTYTYNANNGVNPQTFGLTAYNGTQSYNISQASAVLSGGSNLYTGFPTNSVYNWTSPAYYSELHPNIPLKPSTTYTFSYSYSVISGTLANLRIGLGGGPLNAYWLDYLPWTSALLSAGKLTFTTPATLAYPYFQFRPVLDIANAGEAKNVNLWNIKLEEGSTATAWTASP
ncbi:prepilin-type N-terminal cleavage/methylation domain-containing protein [Candidatus Saccharibacteria bacterium]|nr:prepilin-type N-terminal cleavage/methylation domain-containing protein [Candidatus Saccharibacteria bacterium]